MTLDFRTVEVAKGEGSEPSLPQRSPGTYLVTVILAVALALGAVSFFWG